VHGYLEMQPTLCAIQKVKSDMAPGKSDPGGGTEAPPRRNDLPPEIKKIIWPALQIGGLAGTSSGSFSVLYSFQLLLNPLYTGLTRANGWVSDIQC